jgi:hypothetical protein
MAANLRFNFMPVIRYLFHYLYHNGMISKETAHSIAGGFVFIPTIVVPMIFVVVLLFSLRNATARTISILNLILASGAILITIMAFSGCRSALSPPPPPNPHPETARGIIMDLVAVCWFAGALGLFSCKRLAWVASVVGAGAAVCFFGASFFTIIALYLYPTEEMNRNRNFGDFGNTGYIFALISIVTQFSFLLAISLRLLIGLFRMRRDIFMRRPPVIDSQK